MPKVKDIIELVWNFFLQLETNDHFRNVRQGSYLHARVWTMDFDENKDRVAQTSINFKSQLNIKFKLISCTFQVHLSVN